MWTRSVVALLLMVGSAQTLAAGLDLRLSNESAEITYLLKTSAFYSGGADVGAGVFFNEDDDWVPSISWVVSGQGLGQVKALSYGVGVKAYGLFVDKPEQDGGAIAIGGHLRYLLPVNMPIAVVAEGFTSPKITSFNDVDNILELRLSAEFEVNQAARAYIGYRSLEADLDKESNYELDNSLHVGVRLTF